MRRRFVLVTFFATLPPIYRTLRRIRAPTWRGVLPAGNFDLCGESPSRARASSNNDSLLQFGLQSNSLLCLIPHPFVDVGKVIIQLIA